MDKFNLNFGQSFGGKENDSSFSTPFKQTQDFLKTGSSSALGKPFELDKIEGFDTDWSNFGRTQPFKSDYGFNFDTDSFSYSPMETMGLTEHSATLPNTSVLPDTAGAKGITSSQYMEGMMNVTKDAAATSRLQGGIGLGIQAVTAIANIAMGIKNYHLAKKQFNFEKSVATTNINNQVTGLTNTIKDRSDMAHWGTGEEARRAKESWERDRMKNIENLDGKIDVNQHTSVA